ncbi:hypothetical protein MHYP_G00108210 [Metynnis hypsauchen]
MMMMMMALLWVLIVSLYIICVVEGVELNEQFISVKTGENVTLSCKVEKSDKDVKTAESLNYAPIHFKENKPKPGRVKREQPEDIVYSQNELFTDSAQAVRNSEPLVISAEPGEAVTLNCTFVDDSNKDVRMWYKQRLEHAPLEVGSKFETKPAVISDQFDKSRFKLNRIASGISLSIERVTKEDEGMYFCGETGKKTLDFSTATFLAVTGKTCQSVIHSFPEILQDQDSDAEEFSFAPLNFSDKRRLLKENAFTRVRFFPVSDFKPIQKHNIVEKRRK